MRRTIAAIVLAVSVAALSAHGSFAQDAKGAGSTFVAPVMQKWLKHYVTVANKTIDYQPVGSGAGIKAIEAGEVDFGATDKPLDPAELAKYGLAQFPVVVGAIVPVVNLPGISTGQIRFSGRLLAKIFMGTVSRWNDPDVAYDNPSITLPDLPIVVVYRSDGSGSTYNFSDFLSRSSPEWKSTYGTALTLNLPTGVPRKGSAGVASAVQQAIGAIGYVEYTYAVQNSLTYAAVANAFRNFIIPTSDSFRIAASAVNWARYPDFSVLMTNATGAGAYPIAATTFIVMPKAPKNPARGAAALAFFKWALENGDSDATQLQYVALPPDVVAMIESYWGTHFTAAPAGKNAHR